MCSIWRRGAIETLGRTSIGVLKFFEYIDHLLVRCGVYGNLWPLISSWLTHLGLA